MHACEPLASQFSNLNPMDIKTESIAIILDAGNLLTRANSALSHPYYHDSLVSEDGE